MKYHVLLINEESVTVCFSYKVTNKHLQFASPCRIITSSLL